MGNKYTWLNKEIRSNLFGGLAACFARHAETDTGTRDPKFPSTVYETPNGSPVKVISQLDVNSLYPCIMKQKLPTGNGILYNRRDGGIFQPDIMAENKGQNSSDISYHWLNAMQSKFHENGDIVKIQCALNGREKTIGSFFLDGYVEVGGKTIGLDFLGCRFHKCDNCNTECVKNDVELAKDAAREEFIKERLDEYITIHECVYRKEMKNNDPPLLSFGWTKNNITEQDIIDGIASGELFGLVKVDITTPDSAKEKVCITNIFDCDFLHLFSFCIGIFHQFSNTYQSHPRC